MIRTERLEELFDVAALLSHQPVPRGTRGWRSSPTPVARASSPLMPARQTGSSCPTLSESDALGAAVVPPGRRQRGQSRRHARVGAARALSAGARSCSLRDDQRRQRHHDLHPAARDRSEVGGDSDRRGCTRPSHGKPVLGVFMQAESAPEALAPIPAYAFPESAALALARATTYGLWRAKPVEAAPEPDHFDGDRIRSIVDVVLTRGGGWANAGEATALLAAAGIEHAASSCSIGSPTGSAGGIRRGISRRSEGARADAAPQDRTRAPSP